MSDFYIFITVAICVIGVIGIFTLIQKNTEKSYEIEDHQSPLSSYSYTTPVFVEAPQSKFYPLEQVHFSISSELPLKAMTGFIINGNSEGIYAIKDQNSDDIYLVKTEYIVSLKVKEKNKNTNNI